MLEEVETHMQKKKCITQEKDPDDHGFGDDFLHTVPEEQCRK